MESNLNQKGFAHIFILVFILLICAAAYFIWRTQALPISIFGCRYEKVQCVQAPCNPVLICNNATSQAIPTPTSTAALASSTDETANWKTYKATKFSFKYPNEMELIKESDQKIEAILWGTTQDRTERVEFQDGINLYIAITSKNVSFEQFVKDKRDYDIGYGKTYEISKDVLGSKYALSYKNDNVIGTFKHVFADLGNNEVVEIYYDINTDPQNKGYQKIIDKILASFSFNY